jgi:hypothetical protein
MNRRDLGCYVGVFSSGRAANVPQMQRLVGHATWFVGAGEMMDYANAGAASVIEAGLLCPARNAVLENAFRLGVPAVMLSDDLRGLAIANDEKKANKASFPEFVSRLLADANEHGAKLAGCAPTANAFYYQPSRPVSLQHFIVGDLMLVLPSPERFDESFRLKEDYDFTCQHLASYGAVARCNALLANFAHRSNAGGAVAYRTSAGEQAAIALLRAKWGDVIRDNPRRPDEILLRWPKK